METALGNHDDLISMRERMRLRLHTEPSSRDSDPVFRSATLPILTLESASRGHEAANAHHDAAVSLPPANILADLRKAQALRERINSRSTQSVRGSVQETTKDVYPHEQPFPVNTIFEMDRVTTSAHQQREQRDRHETFLMAAESASVLRCIEARLGEEAERAILAEKRLEVSSKALERMTQERDQARRDADVAKAKVTEITQEMEKLKKSHADHLEVFKKEHADALLGQKVGLEMKHKTEVGSANDSAKKELDARSAIEHERRTLEALVQEMREQLASNGIALQNQTLTVRQLTEELLGARAQVTNLAVALQDKEKEVKSCKADLHKISSDAAKTGELKAALAQTKEALEKAQLELAAAKKDLEAFPTIKQERDRLVGVTSKLEAETRDKSMEMARLRAQVESVRTQADAAYQHSSQFHQQHDNPGYGMPPPPPGIRGVSGGDAANYGGLNRSAAPMSYPGAAGGMPPGSMAYPQTDALRREIEEEERRAVEEQRRWRQRQNKP
jgi:hypothetical protein